MAEYVKKISLDFNAEYPIQTVFAKQLDENSRFLLIEPQLDGNKFDVRGCDVQLYAKAADETVKAISGAVNESGEMLFDLTDIISSSGIFVCDAKILGNGRMLSSCLFFVNVKQSILWSNKIKLYRNSAYSDIVQIKNDGEYYILGNTEKLIFTVKKDAEILIRKELTDSDYIEEENGYLLSLSSAETNIPVGTYYYNIKLKRADSEFEPVISKSKFIITEE